MGIGKTTIAIATCHIQHIFNLLYDEILKHPERHLPHDQPLGAPCPSNQAIYKRFGFDCPCALSGVTSGVKASLGVHGVLAPLGLLGNWCKEWHACYADGNNAITKESNPLGMKLVVAHASAPAGNKTSDAQRDMLADEDDLGDPDDHETTLTCRPRVVNSRVFFVTTSNSCLSHLVQVFGRTKRVKGRRTKTLSYTALVVSSVWRDESHKECLSTSTSVKVLDGEFFRLPQNNGCHLNIMSGTLISSGPLDIAAYLGLMVRPAWTGHPVLARYCEDEMTKLGNRWNLLVRDGKANATASRAILEELRPVIEATTLRFTPKSNFRGAGPVVRLPPHRYLEVACTHSEEWEARLLKHKEEEDAAYTEREAQRRQDYLRTHSDDAGYTPLKEEGTTFHYRSRLVASFPYLLDLTGNGGGALRLTEQEWSENQMRWHGAKEPYLKHIHEIAASSGKLLKIQEQIDTWRDTIDGEGKPARLIFASFFFVGARIIYLVRSSRPCRPPNPNLR